MYYLFKDEHLPLSDEQCKMYLCITGLRQDDLTCIFQKSIECLNQAISKKTMPIDMDDPPRISSFLFLDMSKNSIEHDRRPSFLSNEQHVGFFC
jgi:hypothetical protein